MNEIVDSRSSLPLNSVNVYNYVLPRSVTTLLIISRYFDRRL